MNTFKHKSLYAAVAGLSALGATGVAQAVSVNHDGLGQVLIYPYYTVRSVPTGLVGADAAYNSLLSVVNSTNSAKAVKVRFLEGKNSREVLDFNLYLSKHDVWTAAIIPTLQGAGIFTVDKSCTTPNVSNSATAPTEFVNYAYAGDTGGDSLDRTREGYVEIIEMSDVIGSTATAVTHGSNGLPPAWVTTASPPGCNGASALSDSTVLSNSIPGAGGLFGSMTLINVLKGEDFGIDPTALDGFSSQVRWFPPADVKPTLADVNPKTSVVVSGPSVLITDWSASSNAVDPVSAILMHNNVYNEFVLEAATASGTDWVLTFPTKRDYVFVGTGSAQKLFERNFNNGACDAVSLTFYDREEKEIQPQTGFSPPPETKYDSFCWEANVVSYRLDSKPAPAQSAVLGSKNFYSQAAPWPNGWVAMSFTGGNVTAGRHRLIGGASTVFNTRTGQTSSSSSTTFNGLPVIGFAAITFENGNLAITTAGGQIQSNYGGNFNHKVTTSVTTGSSGQ